MRQPKSNIVLTGMPGVGKSTAGVILAKRLNMEFIDTDIYIQRQTGQNLQQLISALGLEAFCRLEDELVAGIDLKDHVIATGGSVIYGRAAMAGLKAHGLVVWLDLPYDELFNRLEDLDARGVVMEPGQSLKQLYDLRRPFYRQYADVTLDTRGLTTDQVISRIMESLAI